VSIVRQDISIRINRLSDYGKDGYKHRMSGCCPHRASAVTEGRSGNRKSEIEKVDQQRNQPYSEACYSYTQPPALQAIHPHQRRYDENADEKSD
jgi:hypothetical protein